MTGESEGARDDLVERCRERAKALDVYNENNYILEAEAANVLREAASHIEHLEAQLEAADELARITDLQTAPTPPPGISEIRRRRAVNVYFATRNPKEEGHD